MPRPHISKQHDVAVFSRLETRFQTLKLCATHLKVQEANDPSGMLCIEFRIAQIAKSQVVKLRHSALKPAKSVPLVIRFVACTL